MSTDTNTAITTELPEIMPDINLQDHAISNEIWMALEAEISQVVEAINSGTELEVEDVKRVQSLRKQVDEYTTTFNKAMTATRNSYKAEIERRLSNLGYATVENYIQKRRQAQTAEQNTRVNDKIQKLTQIVNETVDALPILKSTALAPELVHVFTSRFPIIRSAAATNIIKDWTPYTQVIQGNLQTVEAFLSDERYVDVKTFPAHSQSMQRLLQYLKSGDINLLREMSTMLEMDKPLIADRNLRNSIQTKQQALQMISHYASVSTDDTNTTLLNISKIVQIAQSLPQ